MKSLTFLLSVLVLCSNFTIACSMYKLTVDGKTMVGNNEDWISPNGQFWFEPATGDAYGVMYMGFLNDFAQGAINEKGLMFDGFFQPFKAVENTAGKLNIPVEEALIHTMQTMSEVEEVQEYFQTINLSELEQGQLVFVDKSGTYLIIEGDEMIIGDEPEKSFSNFYYSDIKSLSEVNLQYFQNGQQFINSTASSGNFDYCSTAMASFSQSSIASTQYTTIYDLNALKVRVHFFHDFESFVEIDLLAELKKGKQKKMIASLFPKESRGYKYYLRFNNPEHPTALMEEFLSDKGASEQDLISGGIDNVFQMIGYEWLEEIKNANGAVKVFTYGVELMPSSAKMHEGLADSYFELDELALALSSYKKAYAIDPESETSAAQITEIEARLKSK